MTEYKLKDNTVKAITFDELERHAMSAESVKTLDLQTIEFNIEKLKFKRFTSPISVFYKVWNLGRTYDNIYKGDILYLTNEGFIYVMKKHAFDELYEPSENDREKK